MTKSILIATLSFVCFWAQAQTTKTALSRKERKAERLADEHIFKTKSIGLSFRNAQNTVVAPLVYSGAGVSFSTEKQRTIYQKMTTSNATLQYHLLNAANSEHANHSGTFQFGKDFLKQTFSKKLYLGAMIQMNGNIRVATALGNNAFQYELFPVIGISSRYKRDFQLLNRNLEVEAIAKLPLIGALMATPKYAFSFDKQNIEVTSLHNMFNPQTQFWVNLPATKRLSNRQYRLGYEWNLNRFARGNGHHVTMGTHTFHLVATLDKWK
jgi:hypothetical protein